MRFILALLLTLFASSAFAQAPTPICFNSFDPPSTAHCQQVDSTNPFPVSATLSGFQPGLNYATLTATGSSASVALPTGTTVQFQNTGVTAVSCTLGIGSATATTNEIIIQSGSTKSVVVGSNTFGACIDQTGSASNLVVLNGGTGLGTDSGGGGGGGSITNPTVISSFDSGPISATGTVNGSSHAAGTSVGGLYTLPLARTNGGSGILTSISYISPGGSTGQLVLRGWTKSPSSTCTDQTAYSNNSADDPYLIPGTPTTITPAAPAVTTGDARTYASLTGLTWDYKNLDTTPSQNIYFCLVTVATDTADESSSPRLTVSGPQN